MTSFFESLKLALGALMANKLRAILTITGSVVGIFSIIVIMTVITMLQSSIESGVASLAKNTFQIQKFPAIRTGGPGGMAKYRNRKDLTLQEYDRLKSSLTSAKYIGAEQWNFGKVIKFRNKETNPNVSISGITASAIKTNDWKVELGREMRESDIENSTNFVILGKDVSNKIFDNLDPIGKEIRVDGKPMKVIGVYEAQGQMFGQSRDNFVTIPITTYQSYYGKYRNSINITVTSHSKEDYDKVIETAIGVMRGIRKNPPGEESDFEIFSNESVLSQINDVTIYAKIGAGVISFISLLAAGIGIMNIMLVSVTERTREVGIRKAIGAKSYQILTQFLIEAILLCFVGGIVGIILGVSIGNMAGSLLSAQAAIPYDWIFIGIGLCVLVGVIFGTYPAYKAANLDPIEALRQEQ